jgi:Gametolysin peptidase M11
LVRPLSGFQTVYFPAKGGSKLRAKITDPSTRKAYTKGASSYDVLRLTSLYSTHKVDGPRDMWFVLVSLKKCPGVTYLNASKAPGVAYTKRDFESLVPKMRQLLERVSNGHVTFGTVNISTLELTCQKSFTDTDAWCGSEQHNWASQAIKTLGIPNNAHLILYVGPVKQCGLSGLGFVHCRPRKDSKSVCALLMSADSEITFVHELIHNFGSKHANNSDDKEYADETCIMGHGNEILNAAHTYLNGWLDDAEIIELESVCGRESQGQVDVILRSDTKHGIILYLSVVVFYGDKYDLMLLPFCILSYRVYNNKKKKRVLVHMFNAGGSFPPVGRDMRAPATNLMANLDAVGSSYVLDTTKAQAVPLAFRYTYNATLQEEVSPLTESLLRLLGFTEFSRRAMSKLTITVVSKDSEKAVVHLEPKL